ncbi:MAG: four helix bundle protein [Bacteroidetes bacterium]|nr:four helix bundle protein [Bacteroidota bacterium]
MNKSEPQSPPESPKTASDQSCQGPKKFDLEGRLIRLAVQIVRIADAFPDTKAGRILSDQLIRSGTSAALNYGEAQSAESKRDFVHKLKIVLKELRESSVALKIASELGFLGGQGEELFALPAGANFEVGGSLIVDVGGQEQLQRVISDRAAVGEFDDGQAVVKDLEGSFLPFSG